MSYNVLLSDAVNEYLHSQDRSRQKIILKHFYKMRDDPFKGNVIRLRPTLDRLYRKRIGSDRVLFSIRAGMSIWNLWAIVAAYTSWQRGWREIEIDSRSYLSKSAMITLKMNAKI